MATARRVIFSTYVIPTKIVDMEETTVKHEEFLGSTSNDSLTKTLGGRGNATINATQWGDEWSSTTHGTINKWEEFDTVFWEDVLMHPGESGKIDLSDSATLLTTTSTTDPPNVDCAFLYIKNLGGTNEVLVSLNGTGGNYFITIPPEGSVHLRGTDDLECTDIYVKCSSGETTEIEYLIAKE